MHDICAHLITRSLPTVLYMRIHAYACVYTRICIYAHNTPIYAHNNAYISSGRTPSCNSQPPHSLIYAHTCVCIRIYAHDTRIQALDAHHLATRSLPNFYSSRAHTPPSTSSSGSKGRRRRQKWMREDDDDDDEEEEEEESLFKADAVNEEDSERDRATQV